MHWCKCEKKWVSEPRHKHHINCKCKPLLIEPTKIDFSLERNQKEEYWANKYYRNQEYWQRVVEREQRALNDNIEYWQRQK